jgi:signal transduction histidine kinase
MTIARLALGLLRVWVGPFFAALLMGLVFAPQVQAHTMELTQAQVTATADGATTTQVVQLPYHWDLYNKGHRGEAVFALSFDLADVPMEPWGLYLSRLGNAYEIWLNGTLLQRQGDLVHYNGADYSQVPRYVAIPPGVLRSSNQFRVHIRADVGRRGGLAKLVLGPQDAVQPAYVQGYLWRGTGSAVVAVFSLLVGLIALSVWLTQVDITHSGRARRDPLYLFAALAELFWAFGVGYALIEDPPLPWPWWGLLPIVASSAWMCNMLLFCVEVADWGQTVAAQWLRRWLGFFMVGSVSMAYWALAGGQPLALTISYALSGVTALTFGVVFVWHAARRAPMGHRVVAAAIFLNALVGLRDLYVYRIHPSYGEITWIRYSSLLFGLSLGYIVLLRFRAASAQVRDLMATLAARVAQKEAELGESYHKLEALAREQERTAERTRILRDMHDGVGSHISSAIRQLQSDREVSRRVGRAEVLRTLRDALDQLKLSIDAINLPPGDITSLLANLRYRLEPRLAASGIELQWDVDLLPVMAHLDASAMRQLQFMLFEALSNVLQHAQAKTLRVEAHAEPPAGASGAQVVRVRVADDGVGFDTLCARRKGQASMHERATAIGAQLQISSQPGRTVVEIRFG